MIAGDYDSTSFQLALKSFSKEEQKTIKDKLSIWSNNSFLGRNIVRNIEKDCFLPSIPNMKQFLELVLKNNLNKQRENIKKFENEYKKECFREGHSFQGGNIIVEEKDFPKYIGRAVEYDNFCSYLSRNYKEDFPTLERAEEFIDSLQVIYSQDIISKYSAILLTREPGKVWITWNEDYPYKDPFQFMRKNYAKEVTANLGLIEKSSKKGLILFVYKFPEYCNLYRPTIADAALYPYFEPPSQGFIKYGLTKNIIEGIDTESFDIQPRPEALHQPVIQIKDLNLPIRLLV